MTSICSNGTPLDLSPAAFGELEDSSGLVNDTPALRSTMATQGYLFFRNLIDPALIAEARKEILLKYATIGEISPHHPIDEAIYDANNALGAVNLRAFTQSVRDGLAYKKVVLADRVLDIHQKLLGGNVRAFDFRWPRLARPGEGCGIHCDGPYMNRATENIFSSWIPLGRIDRNEGALMVLERGPEHLKLLGNYLSKDADRDKIKWLSADPAKFRATAKSRWLSADFKPGDVLCFRMDTVHAALDNMSDSKRCRLSSDSRYQLVDEPADERWNGEQPQAHGKDKVFFPGLGSWNNENFQDEWKTVDDRGRLMLHNKVKDDYGF